MDDNEFEYFQKYYQPSDDFDQVRFLDDEGPIVTQNLAPEQYQYEFPSKQCLKELEYLDKNQEFSFFDESSFTTSSLTVYSSVDQTIVKQDQECLVDDSRLSPLQLPAQMINIHHSSLSSPLIRPVGPSSFLSDKHHMSHVTPSRDLQKDDIESLSSCRSKVVLIQLNKSSMIQRSLSISDEGYDDTELDEKELESQCTFYPISDDEEEEDIIIRDYAAIKIQSVWRGYHCRQKLKRKQPNQLIYNLAHQFHIRTAYQRITALEQQLRQETAMRMAFEKAMEDMTVLIDQQQKVLYDRLEQEVHLRQMYENKLNQALPNLENKLKKEMNARSKLEDMMTRVLDQLHESETARIEQSKQQAELQSKLDLVLNNVQKINNNNNNNTNNNMKKSPSTTTRKLPQKAKVTPPLHSAKKIVSNNNNNNNNKNSSSSSHIIASKNLLVERPSVIPSNRKPLIRSKQKKTQ